MTARVTAISKSLQTLATAHGHMRTEISDAFAAILSAPAGTDTTDKLRALKDKVESAFLSMDAVHVTAQAAAATHGHAMPEVKDEPESASVPPKVK